MIWNHLILGQEYDFQNGMIYDLKMISYKGMKLIMIHDFEVYDLLKRKSMIWKHLRLGNRVWFTGRRFLRFIMISYKNMTLNKSHELKYMIYSNESFMICIHLITWKIGMIYKTSSCTISEGFTHKYDLNKTTILNCMT